MFAPFLCAGLLFGTAVHGQDASSTEKPAVKRQVRGRLPAYFAAVVTKKQREEIYRIQARVQQEIEELRQRILELEQTRAKEVDEVLDAEQLEQVMKKRAAAAKRRRSRRGQSEADPAAEG
jgi:hypothetical protein